MNVEELKLKIPQGRLHGTVYISDLDKHKYFAFFGIPYAKPPINNLRFMPPEPWEKWVGIRKADSPASHCIHRFGTQKEIISGTEDCLYLNVYTPQPPIKITSLKPVIVIMHCGGHAWGSANPDSFGSPDFIVHHDVIWVAMNYRLHALGFLNLDLPNCAGNMGLKDQVMALKWVQENIKYFGGDPNNVTITGSSSGATDVHLHLLSPMSKGLFHKAIIQSGWALNPIWGCQSDHVERAKQLAVKLGYQEEDENKDNRRRILRFLKSIPPLDLLYATIHIQTEEKTLFNTRPHHSIFHPTIESIHEGAFLTTSPRNLIYSLDTVTVPIIWGITFLEGAIAFLTKPLRSTLRDIIRDNLWLYKLNDDHMLDVITEKVKKFYKLGDVLADEHILSLSHLYTDMWFAEWNFLHNFLTQRPDSKPLYLYLFVYDGEFNIQRKHILKRVDNELPNYPSHGDDALYFTYHKSLNILLENVPPNMIENAKPVVNYMTTLFSNFVKTGNPDKPKTIKSEWKPYNVESPSYLEFGDKLIIREGIIFEDRVQFWNKLITIIKQSEAENSFDELIEKIQNIEI